MHTIDIASMPQLFKGWLLLQKVAEGNHKNDDIINEDEENEEINSQ